MLLAARAASAQVPGTQLSEIVERMRAEATPLAQGGLSPVEQRRHVLVLGMLADDLAEQSAVYPTLVPRAADIRARAQSLADVAGGRRLMRQATLLLDELASFEFWVRAVAEEPSAGGGAVPVPSRTP